jgi:hypothetical protein
MESDMVINNCKHDGGWYLLYCAGVDHYVYRCERCQVFKLNFNPTEAGLSIGRMIAPDTKEITDTWRCKVFAYVKKDNTKPGPILSTEGKF